MEILTLDSIPSTNSYVAAHSRELPDCVAISAREQTAGRGQRGNGWESEPGQNVTLSILLRPEALIAPRDQFVISECVSVAAIETLRHFMPDLSEEVAVKWPNDIYVGQRKICGILIENSIQGNSIKRVIAGIGLNVNQQRFISDAPNPVSMFQLTRKQFDVDSVARHLCDTVEQFICKYCYTGRYEELHKLYMSCLWRRKGLHPYIDVATSTQFYATISGIAPTGQITLTEDNGCSRTYSFKEVKFTGLIPCPGVAL